MRFTSTSYGRRDGAVSSGVPMIDAVSVRGGGSPRVRLPSRRRSLVAAVVVITAVVWGMAVTSRSSAQTYQSSSDLALIAGPPDVSLASAPAAPVAVTPAAAVQEAETAGPATAADLESQVVHASVTEAGGLGQWQGENAYVVTSDQSTPTGAPGVSWLKLYTVVDAETGRYQYAFVGGLDRAAYANALPGLPTCQAAATSDRGPGGALYPVACR